MELLLNPEVTVNNLLFDRDLGLKLPISLYLLIEFVIIQEL